MSSLEAKEILNFDAIRHGLAPDDKAARLKRPTRGTDKIPPVRQAGRRHRHPGARAMCSSAAGMGIDRIVKLWQIQMIAPFFQCFSCACGQPAPA
ncbi:MAG: hypothetical protein ACJA1L_001246 [Paracoccaceae bacterium]|jgi:hypothetical protein